MDITAQPSMNDGEQLNCTTAVLRFSYLSETKKYIGFNHGLCNGVHCMKVNDIREG